MGGVASQTRVRTLTATAVLSLVVHGAALAWVIATPKPQPTPQVAPPAPRAEDEVLTIVELLPEPSATPAPMRGAEATVASAGTPKSASEPVSARSVAVSTTPGNGTPATETRPPVTAPEPPVTTPPRRVLGMRHGPQVASTTEMLAASAAEHPQEVPELPDYPGLRTGVALDSARARYKHGDMKALGEVVALEDAQAAEELKPQKDGTWKSDKTTFVAKVDKDGTVHFKDKRNLQVHGLVGTFDTTDWIMRSKGMDPYASEKREYLDRTRDQRVEIGRAYRKDQLSQSDQLMTANLVRLWATTHDARARKQGLLELWDECAEAGDADLVAGGRAARAMVERWMQVKLTGADRFTTDELAQFNAHRRSRAVLALDRP